MANMNRQIPGGDSPASLGKSVSFRFTTYPLLRWSELRAFILATKTPTTKLNVQPRLFFTLHDLESADKCSCLFNAMDTVKVKEAFGRIKNLNEWKDRFVG